MARQLAAGEAVFTIPLTSSSDRAACTRTKYWVDVCRTLLRLGCEVARKRVTGRVASTTQTGTRWEYIDMTSTRQVFTGNHATT
jgi:hypothetical protein